MTPPRAARFTEALALPSLNAQECARGAIFPGRVGMTAVAGQVGARGEGRLAERLPEEKRSEIALTRKIPGSHRSMRGGRRRRVSC